MKLIQKFAIVAISVVFFSANAQDVRGAQSFDYNGTLITKDSNDPLEGVSGNPYFNEVPKQGIYIKNDSEKYSAYFKYNIYFDRIEFSENMQFTEAKELPKDESVLIQLGTDLFRYQEIATKSKVIRGYFEIIAMDNDKPAILKKYKQYVQELDQNRANSYGTRKQGKKLRDREYVYYMYDGLANEIENHKKKSLDAFPEEYEDQLKDYIKENKLKFNDDYRGLQELVKEYYRIRSNNEN